jgi:hypothetical protein
VALTASAGGVSAKVNPHRPSWADMKLHYPGKNVSIDFLYNGKIKGQFTNMEQAAIYANTCAIRMSYALLRSGFALQRVKGSVLGGDNKWYWTTVVGLRAELIKRFKGFDAELKFDLLPQSAGSSSTKLRPFAAARRLKAQQFLDAEMKGKKGIVAFRVSGWADATGHFTLWDGEKSELAYAKGHDDPRTDDYYFWLTTTDALGLGALVQVTQIQFWELK